jgi:outer membrane receptor protein involved in Fe transport
MKQNSIALYLTGTALAAFATQAQAKEAASSAAPVAAEQAAPVQAVSDQDIVVTATKRPEILLNVPQSISVVTGKTLELQHANNFQDYLKLVPGLQLDQDTPGESRLILRGVNTGGVASTVGVYVDDTPFGSSSGLVNGAILAGDFDTFDVNRIEVLRGPQGTLYGASSLSGVLRFVTNQPDTAAFSVHGRAGLESIAHSGELGYSTNLMVNVPLGPTVAFRASGFYRKDPGFIDSRGTTSLDGLGVPLTSDVAKDINDSKSYGGRASLLFRPSDAVSVRLTAIAQDIKADAPSIILANPDTLKPMEGLTQPQFVPQFSDIGYRIYNATGNFDLGFAKLTSSTSYGTQKQHLRIDFTFPLSSLLEFGFGLPPNEFFEGQHTNDKKFTQEFRLNDEGRLLDWLIGAYYTNETGLIQQDFTAVEPGTLTPLDLTPIIGDLGLGSATLDSKYKEYAGFADATVHFTPQFDLELGGRYSHNKQSAHQVTSGLLAGPSDLTAHSSESVFTYSIAPKYKLSPNATIYARIAKGFRPGGPNVLAPGAPPEFATYHSDSLISYEAGVKAQSVDHRFSVDAAAFHIDWKDIQLFAVISGFGFNTNGSTAKSDGFELTATARPIPGLDLSANAAYTNARLTGPTPATVGGRDGDQLPFTPKFAGSLNADYNWLIGGTTTAHFGGSFRHLSGQTAPYDADFVAAHGHQRHIPAYDVIDLNAGVGFGHWNVEAYVKNLGDSRGISSVTGLTVFGPPDHPDAGFPLYPNGAIGTGIIRPRTIGVTVGFQY